MPTLAALALLLAAGPLQGAPAGPKPPQAASERCAAPAHRQFDFWAGEWDGYDVGAEQTLAARVRVDVILDGCALHEVYEGTNGLVGQSLSAYDATRGAWHQTWVTNRGQLLMVEGRLQGEALLFEGTSPGAGPRPLTIRVAFKPEAGGVRQTARTSADGGKTWEPLFDMIFRPHRSSLRAAPGAGPRGEPVPAP